jgi:hypothetical protein
MVYVVERYLPGLCRADLLTGLSKLESALEELRDEGSAVRYFGSTIVLGDEACFCQFEGPSEAAVAEVNRIAGLPFDRIVPAVLVHSNQRTGDMSISTSIPRTARLGRSHRLVLVAALAAVIAVAAWAIAMNVSGSSNRQVRTGVLTRASMLGSLTPQERQYVVGILSLTPAQLRAAFGTDKPFAGPSARVTPPAVTPDSGARLDHQGIRAGTSGSVGTPASAASCGDVCSSSRQVSTIAATPTPASTASCGDVCSSSRHASTIAGTPSPSSAASCGDVCSSYRQAR